MTRVFNFATLVAALCSSAFAADMPAIHGQVYNAASQQVVAGAEVHLYMDDGDMTYTNADTPLGMAMTDANGMYEFDSLDSDETYFVMHADAASAAVSSPGIGFLIDEFEATQSVSANPLARTAIDSLSGAFTSIFGGVRDLYLEMRDGVADGSFRVNPYQLSSDLQMDTSAGFTGLASVIWDGVSGSTGLDPDHGLDADFTGGGLYEGVSLRLAVDDAGAGQLLELIIHSADGSTSTAEIEFPVVDNVEPTALEFVPFSAFTGDADLTEVSAFQMVIDAEMPSLDARIDLVGLAGPDTVNFFIPEPSSSLLLLSGLVVALGYRRRR